MSHTHVSSNIAMYEKAKQFTLERPRFKRVVGIVLIIAGIVAMIMPIVPGLFLLVIGLEIYGIRLLFFDRFIERTFGKKRETPTE